MREGAGSLHPRDAGYPHRSPAGQFPRSRSRSDREGDDAVHDRAVEFTVILGVTVLLIGLVGLLIRWFRR